MLVGVDETTVNVALPICPLKVADIVVLPGESADDKPAELTVAAVVFEEAHVADVVTLPVVPLL